MTKTPAPYFILSVGLDEWSDPMTTDVLVEQFDFAEHTGADLDKVVALAVPGQEFAFICHYYEDDDASWIQTIRCVEDLRGH